MKFKSKIDDTQVLYLLLRNGKTDEECYKIGTEIRNGKEHYKYLSDVAQTIYLHLVGKLLDAEIPETCRDWYLHLKEYRESKVKEMLAYEEKMKTPYMQMKKKEAEAIRKIRREYIIDKTKRLMDKTKNNL